jgi:hypothetical protein
MSWNHLLKPSIVDGTLDYWCRQTHALPARSSRLEIAQCRPKLT